MFAENISRLHFEKHLESLFFLDKSRNFNIIASLIVTGIGLFGNLMIVSVFGSSKSRRNSNHVFLLVMAINDTFYLIIHGFENSLRSYIYMKRDELASTFHYINIIDRYEFVCVSTNYLRNVLRFSSAYMVLFFEI
jgi:hypothetical protein